MLYSTRGIIFHTVPYSDNRVIAKIYTRDFGLLSFIVSVSRTKSGKIKSPLLQPLTQVDLRIEKKEKSQLHSIRDITLAVPYSDLHNNIVKTSIALFIAEVLYKAIREEEPNDGLFTYISEGLLVLDTADEGVSNFHLIFVMQLTRFLGFYPHEETLRDRTVFDLINGEFVGRPPDHFDFLDLEESELLGRLLRSGFSDMGSLALNGEKRKVVLNGLLRYYETHLPLMQKIQSHDVLTQVLS